MALLDKIFPAKKETKEEKVVTATDVLNGLDNARTFRTRIYNTLKEINFDSLLNKQNIKEANITVYIDGEQMTQNGVEVVNEIRSQVIFLLKKLREEDTAELVKIDSERIDSQIFYFAQHLNKALEEAKLNTAKDCVTGLGYGICQGHKPILESDMEQKEREIEKRVEKINIYLSIVKSSIEIDKRKLELESHKEQYKTIHAQFSAAHDLYEKERRLKKSIYDAINGMSGTQCQALGPDYYSAWGVLSADRNLYEQGQINLTMQSAMKTEISTSESQISSLRTAAIARDYEIDDELNDKIKKSLRIVSETMSDVQESILAKQGQLDRLYADFKAATDNAKVREALVKASRHAEQIEHTLEEQAKQETEGQKVLADYIIEQAAKEIKETETKKIAQQEFDKKMNAAMTAAKTETPKQVNKKKLPN